MTDPHPPVLDARMLSDYEARLRRQGVPVDEWDRPGLSREQIDEQLAPLGLTLPEEAYVWWEWHDGSPREGSWKLLAPSGQKALSVAEAVEVYRDFRQIALNLVEADIPELADPDEKWHPAWFPIMGPQHPVVVDCSTTPGEPTPIRFVDYQDVRGPGRPRAASLGQMVTWWSEALDGGAWQWDAQQGEWREDPSLLDSEYRTNPLV